MWSLTPNAQGAAADRRSALIEQFKSQVVILLVGLVMIGIASCVTLPLLVQVLPELAHWPMVRSLVSMVGLFVVAYALVVCVSLAIGALIAAYTFCKVSNLSPENAF